MIICIFGFGRGLGEVWMKGFGGVEGIAFSCEFYDIQGSVASIM
jgi:hypothetical protein